jgi:hypothetical protein
MRMTDITTPENRNVPKQALRFHILIGNAGAKTTPIQVIEINGQEVAVVIRATDVARMRALGTSLVTPGLP